MTDPSPSDPDVYARLALDQLPRLLGNLDRNPRSPTYGCFHRDWWLDKTSDFPDAVRQFAVHALALVYRHPFPGNPYHGADRIRTWAVAGLEFWASIQHDDGSFDEFYPYERGWVGPTAFTLYASSEAYRLLADEMRPERSEEVRRAIERAARFVARGESEEDHLANHHAMACLAIHKANLILESPRLEVDLDRLWSGFLGYWVEDEGWAYEYDGIDPGYLTATVSFLAKILQTRQDPAMMEVIRRAVDTSAWFLFPDHQYAGMLGSRSTQHLYPHGFEIVADRVPMAATMAREARRALESGGLVPPGIMSDRYVVYRVPEFLLAYLDAGPLPDDRPPLPWQRDSWSGVLSEAGIHAVAADGVYAVSNLAKGGVVRVFDSAAHHPTALSDGGWAGTTASGELVTSQWIDPTPDWSHAETSWRLRGRLQRVPSVKVFTLGRNLLFRSALFVLGRIPGFSPWLKGRIRRALMLGSRPVGIRFERRFSLDRRAIEVVDRIRREPDAPALRELTVSGEFHVRYVPQSRYFQPSEMRTGEIAIDPPTLRSLNQGREIVVRRRIALDDPESGTKTEVEVTGPRAAAR